MDEVANIVKQLPVQKEWHRVEENYPGEEDAAERAKAEILENRTNKKQEEHLMQCLAQKHLLCTNLGRVK